MIKQWGTVVKTPKYQTLCVPESCLAFKAVTMGSFTVLSVIFHLSFGTLFLSAYNMLVYVLCILITSVIYTHYKICCVCNHIISVIYRIYNFCCTYAYVLFYIIYFFTSSVAEITETLEQNNWVWIHDLSGSYLTLPRLFFF